MITVSWGTKVISIPQSYLTLVSGTLYELDTNQFRIDLKALEDDEGMPYLDTHRHNTEVTVAGTTFSRTFEIINGYRVEFEDGQYSVRLIGSNNNIFDIQGGILVQNQVQLIATNSAGLISSGGGTITEADKNDIVQKVWDYNSIGSHVLSLQNGQGLDSNQATMLLEIYRLYGLDPTKPLVVTDISRTAGAEINQTINSDNSSTTVTRN